MAVASLNDLKYFMDKTDDVTYAKQDDNGNLMLGSQKSRPYLRKGHPERCSDLAV